MEKETGTPPKIMPRKKKKGMTPFRMVTTILSILAVLALTLFVYKSFGVGDAWVWIQDVLILVLILGLVFLAAVLVVGLLILFRKYRSET